MTYFQRLLIKKTLLYKDLVALRSFPTYVTLPSISFYTMSSYFRFSLHFIWLWTYFYFIFRLKNCLYTSWSKVAWSADRI